MKERVDPGPAKCLYRVGTVVAVLLQGLVLPSPVMGPRAALAQETEDILARMEYDRLRLYSGVGVNLSERLQFARQRVEAMVGTGPYPMSVRSSRWRVLGPDRTDSWGAWTSGRVSAIAIHPRNPDIVYIGAAQGGVWRTDNAGGSWRPLTDNECSLAMGSIAVDPVNPDIIYAGTGEQHFSGDSYYGCGVLRSVNGGMSWEHLGSDVFQRRGQGGARISRVFIDPVTAGSTNATVVMVASTFGLFRSNDSGRTWREVLDDAATDIVMKPGDPSRLYAAVHREGVYRSVDGGVSWVTSSSGWTDSNFGRINLAVAPSAPDVLYASIHDRSEDAVAEGLLMYRSDDGAETWRRLEAEGASCHRQCWYDMTLAVHPDNPEQVHLGTLLLYLSEDGGLTFRENHPRGTYVDQHLMVFDTLSGSDVLYLANDGGVYRSTDAGSSFTSLSTNLAITQFYSGIALHPSDPAVTLGGTQDQGTQRSSAGTGTWIKVSGGDGGSTAFDAEDPDTWYAETQWIAGEEYIGPRKNGYQANVGIDLSERGLFIPPLVMDPIDSRRLYFGTVRLYRTDDAAETWKPIFESPEEWRVITAIGPSASDPNTVYVAIGGWLYNGSYGSRAGVFATHDGGMTWSRDGVGLPDERFTTDLAVHPTDPERAYAVLGGFLTGHVFETTDGGETWEDRSGNLPDMPVNAVLYDPADADGVYIGTDLGVFHSATGGGLWTPLGDGFPMVAVFDLASQPGTGRLVAATHGRGMFEIPIDVPLVARTRPVAVTDTVFAAMDASLAGTVIVAPHGRDDYAASWMSSATGPEWLSVVDTEGMGRGRFQYEIATGSDLRPGDHEGTITVMVAGTDPVEIPVSLHAAYWSRIAGARTGARTSVPIGYSEPIVDSVEIAFTGPRADQTEWTATRAGPGWAELVRASGIGTGTVTWTGDVSDLDIGIYVDTVLASAELAAGSPVAYLDTLAVEPLLAVIPLQTAEEVGVAGLALAPGDTAQAGFTGFGAESAVWTAQTAAPWIGLEEAAGQRADPIAWSRSAETLAAGVHEDTITIGVANHPELRGLIVDRFDVQQAIAVEAAAHHLLGAEGLASGQTRFLDWLGNKDGEFNAGDVLRWLDHCADSGTGGGCATVPTPRAVDVEDRRGRRP